jgi:hypothetical protein
VSAHRTGPFVVFEKPRGEALVAEFVLENGGVFSFCVKINDHLLID